MTHNSESKHSKYIKPSWIQGSYCFILYSYGEAPAPNQVEEFKRVCSHFFEQHPGDIIGDGTIIVSENILIVVYMKCRSPLYSWVQQDWISDYFLPGRS